MANTYLTVDLDRIEHNARTITALCARYGIAVTGVTKCTCGLPEVARAMQRGGVRAIGESRLANIARLAAAGVDAELMMLRLPARSEAEAVVRRTAVSLNSELAVLQALSAAAVEQCRVHDVVLMVDVGDLREGLWPDELVSVARRTVALPGVRLVGLGTNLTCYGGVVPTPENMGRLVGYVDELERTLGVRLRCVSGGNSSALPLIAAGKMPARINHVRIGEAILLGRETMHRTPWPDTHQDAFALHSEVVELKRKPSVPVGELGTDAFGRKPHFVDRGERDRAILAIGRQDVDPEGLRPLAAGMSIIGASSDELIVDVSESGRPLQVGDDIAFGVDYGALLAAMTSPYVDKRLVGRRGIASPPTAQGAEPRQRRRGR